MLDAATSSRRAVRGGARKEPLVLLAALVTTLVIGLFVAYPLYRLIRFPGLQDYLGFFTQTRWLQATRHSLYMTVASTFSATLCGFLFAYAMVRTRVIGKGFWETIAILPILSPPFVVAISYVLLFGGRGLITHRLLGLNLNIYGWHGLWLVQTVTFFPYAYLMLKNTLASIAPSLEYAGQNLGSSRWEVFRRVVLPLSRPGLAGAALLVAISVLADFGNPIIIAGNYSLLPTEAYMQIVGWYNLPNAAVLAVVLLVPTLGLFLLQRRWMAKRVYTTITGKGSSLRRPAATALEQWLGNAFVIGFGGLILLVYGTLLWGAFSKVWGVDWSLTFKNFAYVATHAREIWNSVYFSVLAAALCAIVSSVTAYLVQRHRLSLGSLLDFVSTIPAAVPGVFLGIGFILAFNTPPLVLTGTATIIVLALAFWNLSMGHRAGISALQQLDSSIERASVNLGASPVYTFVHVTLPLLRAATVATFTMAFLRSVTNLSITVFLSSAKTVVGTVSILSLVNNGAWSEAAATTIVLIGIALVVLGVSNVLLRGGARDIHFTQ